MARNIPRPQILTGFPLEHLTVEMTISVSPRAGCRILSGICLLISELAPLVNLKLFINLYNIEIYGLSCPFRYWTTVMSLLKTENYTVHKIHI